MTSLLWTALLIAGVWTLLYFRVSLWICLGIAGGALALWTLLSTSLSSAHWIAWLLFIPGALVLGVRPLRRKLVTLHLYRLFRKIMPTMSSTEREALESGTVWWDGELFSGAPRWHKLRQMPAGRLTPEEQAFLNGPVAELCAMLDDWDITAKRYDLPPEAWQFIRDNGFFGMIIPKQYGGLGFSGLAHSTVVMKLASRSITAAVTVMVPNSLGPAELLLRYGTDAQRAHFLPRLAQGKEVPCFALTGPEAGSDAGSMPDTGIVCKGEFEGKSDVLGIRLTWDKRYITLGPVATVLGLAFRLYDPDKLLGKETDLGITLALIATTTPGVEIGRRHFPMAIPFQNGPTRGKDVFIPLDWIIGGRQRAGQGWRMLMECLAAGRSISLPALSTSAGKLASRATGAYARIRRQFKLPIGRFGGVEERLARVAGYTYQMDAVRSVTAAALDAGEQPAVLSAIAKYHLTEKMRTVINDAMDIQGGAAISLGPRNYMARVYQAIPISITVEGANILTRSMIIFGQGAIRCHPYTLTELQAAMDADPARGLKTFDRAILGHAGFVLSNVARSLFLGLTGGRLQRIRAPRPLRRYYARLSRVSAHFALLADAAMLTLGGSLKRREQLSGRLGDILSELYIGSACLKHYEDQGAAPADLDLVRWSLEHALYNAQQAMDGLLNNFPNRWVAWLLRRLIFPWGRPYTAPSDTLGRRVAQSILQPGKPRDRLTQGIFVPQQLLEPLGRLEKALALVIAAEPIEKQIQHAARTGHLVLNKDKDLVEQALNAKVISAEQAEQLRAAAQARREVIAVDDFPQNLAGAQDPSAGGAVTPLDDSVELRAS